MINNREDDPLRYKCGHNFPIAACPYRYCEAKENLVELLVLRDGGSTQNEISVNNTAKATADVLAQYFKGLR